ncbi:hypothetical protein MHYP_G00039850 [Metynnis hypsauchen]
MQAFLAPNKGEKGDCNEADDKQWVTFKTGGPVGPESCGRWWPMPPVISSHRAGHFGITKTQRLAAQFCCVCIEWFCKRCDICTDMVYRVSTKTWCHMVLHQDCLAPYLKYWEGRPSLCGSSERCPQGNNQCSPATSRAPPGSLSSPECHQCSTAALKSLNAHN